MQESVRFKLVSELISRSFANDWDTAKSEWSLSNVWQQAGGVCVCGKEDIVHHSELTNIFTSQTLVVGSCCVKKVLDFRPDLVLTGLQKLKEGGNMNEEAIYFAYNNKWITELERDFCLSVKRKRTFSEKQYNWLITIEKKVLKEWDTQNPAKAAKKPVQADDSNTMTFGKYQGKLLIEVVPQDKAYFNWILTDSNAATDVLKRKIREILSDII
jgi:hypothetical protein